MTEEDGKGAIAFTRMTSADGETHFDDVTRPTTRVTSTAGAPGGDMASPIPAAEVTFRDMHPGYARDWHPAPRRQFVIPELATSR